MKLWQWIATAAALCAAYVAFVLLLGFEHLGVPIQFWRVAVWVAVLILYVPATAYIFQEIPAPRRDYLLAGIILTGLSSVCFAIFNEISRVFGIENSIFVNPVAGAFSMLLVGGGMFHLFAPDMARPRTRLIGIAVGIAVAIAVTVIAPLYR